MTEHEWLSARHAGYLMSHPDWKNRRKLRLLACACCRRMLPAIPSEPAFLATIEAAERYADDASKRKEAVAARKPLREAVRRVAGATPRDPLRTAITRLIDLSNDSLEGLEVSLNHSLYVLKHRGALVKSDPKAEEVLQGDYLREIFGNPFRPVVFDPEWRSDTALSLAQHIYEARDFAQMPILADALQDAGCDNPDVLSHCRDPQQTHVRGCWVVDLVLGKA